MARKTVNVSDLVDMANHTLQCSATDMHELRLGVIGLLENVLHQTGNYKGFQFLDSNGTVDLSGELVSPDDPEHSRRRYRGGSDS